METFSDFQAVKSPVAQAREIANEHYTDHSVHKIEKHALLFRQWAGLGVAAGTPHIGDAKPVDFLSVPLLRYAIAQFAPECFKTSVAIVV